MTAMGIKPGAPARSSSLSKIYRRIGVQSGQVAGQSGGDIGQGGGGIVQLGGQGLQRVVGGHGRAVLKHIVPNSVGTIVVNATFQVADAILLVAYISFLGMGVQKPATDWGAMLTSGITYTYAGAWWLIIPAGLCIVLIVCAFNAVGDGLRDFFDVKGKAA